MASLYMSADRGRQFSRKSICSRNLRAFCAHCVGDGGPNYGAPFKGHVVVQNAHSTGAVCVYILPPAGAQCQ